MGKVYINFEDNVLAIIDGSQRYVDSLANFELDSGQSLPAKPENVDRVRYDSVDGRIIVFDEGDQREVQSTLWKNRLDWMIGAVASLLAAQAVRVPPPNEPPPNSLEARLVLMENSIATLEGQITTLQTEITILTQRIAALEQV